MIDEGQVRQFYIEGRVAELGRNFLGDAKEFGRFVRSERPEFRSEFDEWLETVKAEAIEEYVSAGKYSKRVRQDRIGLPNWG